MSEPERPEISEIGDRDIDEVMSGLAADLADPDRIKIKKLNDAIDQLKYRRDHVAESYELAHIQAELDELEADKAKLTKKEQ